MAMAKNARAVIGIELLAAAQGCDFHGTLASSEPLEAVRAALRQKVPTMAVDRYIYPDMEAANELVETGALVLMVGAERLPGIVR